MVEYAGAEQATADARVCAFSSQEGSSGGDCLVESGIPLFLYQIESFHVYSPRRLILFIFFSLDFILLLNTATQLDYPRAGEDDRRCHGGRMARIGGGRGGHARRDRDAGECR